METRVEKGLPIDWRERIQGKKVIFYNTSISNLLNGGDKHIAKIAQVLETFRTQRDVVLWWRPHPLELSTVESMRPDLARKYTAIRKQYEEEGWGILDTSADIHRAIAISDAYYGDWSSVIHLYRVTGKPILTQNDNVVETLPTLIYPKAALLKQDYFWFIQINSNKLLKVKKDKPEIEKIITIPHEPVYKQRNYNYHIIDCGNQLIILLGDSSYLHIYNMQTEEIESYEIFHGERRFKSEIVLKDDNRLLLFPYNSRELLAYSMEEKKLQEKITFSKNVKLSKNYEQVKKDIYAVDYDSNVIFKINLQNNTYSSIGVGSDKNKYWGIKRAGNYFVLPHTDRKAITLWNEETEEVIELNGFPINYDCLQGNAYLSMYSKDEKVYIMPFCANMIMEVNTLQKTVSQCFEDTLLEETYFKVVEGFKNELFFDSIFIEECVYAYESYQNKWYVFNLDTLEVARISSMEIENLEDRKKIERIIEYKDGNMVDSLFTDECYSICTLNNYIENVKKYSCEYKGYSQKGNVGEMICKCIIKN